MNYFLVIGMCPLVTVWYMLLSIYHLHKPPPHIYEDLGLLGHDLVRCETPILFTLLQEHLKFSVQWREVYNIENKNYTVKKFWMFEWYR